LIGHVQQFRKTEAIAELILKTLEFNVQLGNRLFGSSFARGADPIGHDIVGSVSGALDGTAESGWPNASFSLIANLDLEKPPGVVAQHESPRVKTFFANATACRRQSG
jgi:hypothetical protein